MRKITITRRKTFAGCLAKVLICFTEKVAPDTVIQTDILTLLGTLKNNSVLEAEIPESPITIVAGYDDFGNFLLTDLLVIPEGTEDVHLSGIVKLNPFKGNPFIFDQTT